MNGYCPLRPPLPPPGPGAPSASLAQPPATPVHRPAPARSCAQSFRKVSRVRSPGERSPRPAARRSGAAAPFGNPCGARWRQAWAGGRGRGAPPRRRRVRARVRRARAKLAEEAGGAGGEAWGAGPVARMRVACGRYPRRRPLGGCARSRAPGRRQGARSRAGAAGPYSAAGRLCGEGMQSRWALLAQTCRAWKASRSQGI